MRWDGGGIDTRHGEGAVSTVGVPGPYTLGAGGVCAAVVHGDDCELGVGGQVDCLWSTRGGGEAHLDHPFRRGPHRDGPAGVLARTGSA